MADSTESENKTYDSAEPDRQERRLERINKVAAAYFKLSRRLASALSRPPKPQGKK